MDISDKILKSIEEKHITPRSRWRFLVENYSHWIIFGAAILAGAAALSVAFFVLDEMDWDVNGYLGKNLILYIIYILPYLWIGILAGLIILAYFSFKYTNKGYRYGVKLIVFSILGVSAALGLLLFFGDVGSDIHNTLFQKVPLYNDLGYYKEDVWSNPQAGLLGGVVTDAQKLTDFHLRDFSGKLWEIKTATTGTCCNFSLVIPGNRIELLGSWSTDSIFLANTIRPWNKRTK